MIKKILFDIDQTIIDHELAINIAIKAIFCKAKNKQNYEDFILKYNNYNKLLWNKYENGELKIDSLLNHRDKFFIEELNLSKRDIKEFYDIYISECKIYPVWKYIFNKIKDMNISMYIFSNGFSEIQRKKLTANHINHYFDDMFFGEKYPYNKPNKEFLDQIYTNILPCEKHEVLVIGDSIKNDIIPSKNYGFQTYIFSKKDHYFFENLLRIISK
ncbi:hypothetical protein A1D23_12820 [Chelonobacter oris]|uniref:HAD family hydrolase n=1 Tax=Chelonobacter oris TaxID=505317 RepID=UPI00244AA3DE|nr:HAD-IA family hydrolase [Chelonobacter oris]MDH3001425.1 hypothetical protein [Chelonobacter oris]